MIHKKKFINYLLGAIVISISLTAIFAGYYLVKNPKAFRRSKAASEDFLKINGSVFNYKGQTVHLRGTNFNNLDALGLWQSPNIDRIKANEQDYTQLSEMGGNHVRFLMSYEWWGQDQNKFFQVLDKHIAWAKAHNLWMILDLHVLPNNCYEGYGHGEYWHSGCDFWRSSSDQQKVINFWKSVADRYKNEPTVAGYDLLNEPTPDVTWECRKDWYPLAQRIRDEITAIDQNHFIIIETCSDGSFYGYKFNGNNVVYSVHIYDPLPLTHAEWYGQSGSYPGYFPNWEDVDVYYDKNTMNGGGDSRADIKNLYDVNWSKDNNLPLYVGEWTSQDLLSGWDQYDKDLGELLNQWGVHYAQYTWESSKHRWGIFDQDSNNVPFNSQLVTIMRNLWAGSVKPGTSSPTNPTPTPTSSTPTPAPNGLVQNVSVSSGRQYQQDTAKTGINTYTDRDYKISSLPSTLNNAVYIRTANDDKYSTSSNHLMFNLSKAATVYVAYDPRLSLPNWLSGWTDTGMTLSTGDSYVSGHKIYSRNYNAGQVNLGGNEGIDDSSMYVVIVKETAQITPTPSPSPVPGSPSPSPSTSPVINNELIIDDRDSGFSTTGNWSLYESTATDAQHYNNAHHYTEINDGYDNDTATWSFRPTKTGSYRISVWYPSSVSWRPTDAVYSVKHARGTTNVEVNQQENGAQWVSLGSFQLNANTNYSVTLTDYGVSQINDVRNDLAADALKVSYQEPSSPGGGLEVPTPTPTATATPRPTLRPTITPAPTVAPTNSPYDIADLNQDGNVNILDYLLFYSNYKKPNPDPRADLNGDGKVDLLDYSIFYEAYRK